MNDNVHAANRSPFPEGLRYGLIGILISIVYSFLLYFLGKHYNVWLLMVSMIFPIIMIPIGISAYKKENGNYLKFVNGFYVGMIVTLVYVVGSLLFSQIFTNLIVDNYWEGMADAMEDMLEGFGMSDEQIEDQLVKMEKNQSLGNQIKSSFLTMGIIGLIVSSISAAIMKTPSKDKM